MQAQHYWNEVGSKKEFEDPLYIEKLAPFITPDAKIVEYGCGYGRMMKLLQNEGFNNLIGYDFAPNMLERGKRENPDLDLRLVEKSGKIPEDDQSVDVVVMSTVLCCMVAIDEQEKLIQEILRILKKGGALYITDFLICDDLRYHEKYELGQRQFGEWGIYTTSENLVVRHHTTQAIIELLEPFELQWFKQFDFKTMNQNPAKTFHCVATLS